MSDSVGQCRSHPMTDIEMRTLERRIETLEQTVKVLCEALTAETALQIDYTRLRLSEPEDTAK